MMNIPKEQVITLKVSQLLKVAETSNAYNDAVLNPTDPHDVFAALGSAQPPYFDELMTLYNNLQVMRYTRKVEVRMDVGNVGGSAINVATTPSYTAFTSINDLNQKYSETAQLLPGSGDFGNLKKFNASIEPHKVLGVTKEEYRSNPDFWGSATAAPTNSVYDHLFVGNIDSVTTFTIYWVVSYQLTIRFFGLLQNPDTFSLRRPRPRPIQQPLVTDSIIDEEEWVSTRSGERRRGWN
jgi:hypothetical protein